jgi:alpha-D-ribose 1-methylphosphonate 5-triphosphate synthase subunit PhnI
MGFDTNKWFKQQYFSEAGIILESELVKALNQAIPDNTGYKEFAQAVAAILKDEYGSQNFGPFMEVLHAELDMKPLNEAETSDIETIDFEYTDREGLFRKARIYYKDGSMDSFFGAKFDKFLSDLDINQEFDVSDATDREIFSALKGKDIKLTFSEKDVS